MNVNGKGNGDRQLKFNEFPNPNSNSHPVDRDRDGDGDVNVNRSRAVLRHWLYRMMPIHSLEAFAWLVLCARVVWLVFVVCC